MFLLGLPGLPYDFAEAQVLKDSKVAKNIPTVAEVTQGEVVNFVQGALAQMAAGGTNVLPGGRNWIYGIFMILDV
jgi:hypothetical protein